MSDEANDNGFTYAFLEPFYHKPSLVSLLSDTDHHKQNVYRDAFFLSFFRDIRIYSDDKEIILTHCLLLKAPVVV